MDTNKLKKELSKSGTWSARDFTLWARPTIKALITRVEWLEQELETKSSPSTEPESDWHWGSKPTTPKDEEETDD